MCTVGNCGGFESCNKNHIYVYNYANKLLDQYRETNVMHFLFSLLRIKDLSSTPILVQPNDITRTPYTKCSLCIASWEWASNARNM
jgi:hypothetical protein